MTSNPTRNPIPPESRRCCICGGGPSDGLGAIIRFGGRYVPHVERYGLGRYAHRLCIPAFLRVNPRPFRATVPSGADLN